jgi:hypothetical protein
MADEPLCEHRWGPEWAGVFTRAICGWPADHPMHTARRRGRACHDFVPPPAEVEPHPWYGPCDGFRADGGCSECARVAGAPADPQPEREMTEDEAFAAYWIVTWRSDDGEFIHEGHDAFDTHEAAERYIDSIKDEWTSYDLYRGELIRSGR